MKKVIQTKVIAWLRGFVWAAMIAGCAWAGAQSYTVPSPQGTYKLEAMNSGANAGSENTYVLTSPAGSYHLKALSSSKGAAAANAYVLTSPAGQYHLVTLGAGEGFSMAQGVAPEGAQSAVPVPKDDLFAGTEVFAKGASDITEITMDPDSLNLVDGRDEHRAHNMVLNVVRTYTYDKPGMYNMADVDAIRSKLNTGDWHCSVHVRDLKNGSGSDVCGKHRTDGMKETAIIEVEPKQLTFIHTIRKTGGPGSSELGFFPMLPGLGPMTMLAMTNPEALADMQIGMNGFPMILNAEPNTLPWRYQLNVHPFNDEQMKGLQDQLKTLKVHPMNPEQMQKLKDQMKDFDKSFKSFDKDKTAPAAPPAPQAAPAPAPQPPQ